MFSGATYNRPNITIKARKMLSVNFSAALFILSTRPHQCLSEVMKCLDQLHNYGAS